jgi:TonB family protein
VDPFLRRGASSTMLLPVLRADSYFRIMNSTSMKYLRRFLSSIFLAIGSICCFAIAANAQTDSVHYSEEIVPGVDVDPVPILKLDSLVRCPQQAIDSNWAGNTIVRALVDSDGHVRKVVVDQSSGHTVLDDAAVDAMKRERFAPAYALGKAVNVWFQAPVNFKWRQSR